MPVARDAGADAPTHRLERYRTSITGARAGCPLVAACDRAVTAVADSVPRMYTTIRKDSPMRSLATKPASPAVLTGPAQTSESNYAEQRDRSRGDRLANPSTRANSSPSACRPSTQPANNTLFHNFHTPQVRCTSTLPTAHESKAHLRGGSSWIGAASHAASAPTTPDEPGGSPSPSTFLQIGGSLCQS